METNHKATTDKTRKRETKFDIKDIEKKQRQVLEEETERYDHELIDETN